MGKVQDELTDDIIEFIGRQKMFCVATAPTELEGHLNLSPKGLDSFRILGPNRVAYLDLTGSGIETVAHLRQNGRITLMFCSYEGKPLIVRLYGTGSVVEPGSEEWGELAPLFPEYPGMRTIIVVDVTRVSGTCGYSVPLYEYKGERSQLLDWAEKQGEGRMEEYKAKNNALSIDGIPGLAVKG